MAPMEDLKDRCSENLNESDFGSSVLPNSSFFSDGLSVHALLCAFAMGCIKKNFSGTIRTDIEVFYPWI